LIKQPGWLGRLRSAAVFHDYLYLCRHTAMLPRHAPARFVGDQTAVHIGQLGLHTGQLRHPRNS
jgi:hypothetical protein